MGSTKQRDDRLPEPSAVEILATCVDWEPGQAEEAHGAWQALEPLVKAACTRSLAAFHHPAQHREFASWIFSELYLRRRRARARGSRRDPLGVVLDAVLSMPGLDAAGQWEHARGYLSSLVYRYLRMDYVDAWKRHHPEAEIALGDDAEGRSAFDAACDRTVLAAGRDDPWRPRAPRCPHEEDAGERTSRFWGFLEGLGDADASVASLRLYSVLPVLPDVVVAHVARCQGEMPDSERVLNTDLTDPEAVRTDLEALLEAPAATDRMGRTHWDIVAALLNTTVNAVTVRYHRLLRRFNAPGGQSDA